MAHLKQRPTVVVKINLATCRASDLASAFDSACFIEPINKRRAQGVTSWGEPAEVKEQKASMSP